MTRNIFRLISYWTLAPKIRLRNKNLFWEETLTLKPWEKDKNILQTVPAIVKYDYFV